MNINDLKNKPHVKNSPILKAFQKHQAGIKTVMNDYSSTPLTDLFSMKSTGGREDDRKLSGLVKMAVLETSKLLGQFDFPIAPKLYVTRVRNVKFAKHDESEVVSGQIMITCKIATLSGVDLDAEIPVAISRGEVVSPSVLYHDGREYVMAQSTVDMLTQRNTSYALPQLRMMNMPPYNKEEAKIAVELRNSVGYQPRKPEYPNEKHPVTRTRDRRPRLAAKGAPAGYKIVTDAMDEAQEKGLDTFPRSIYYLLREYVRPIMGEVYQSAWEIPLVNDGYCLNSYGPNRGRAKKE